MKKTVTFSILFIIILSTFNLSFGATSKNLRAKFEVKDIAGTEFKNITIIPYDNSRNDEDNEDYTYKIYLPSGYMVEGTSATYSADRNGKYPFTVYDGSYKKTFVYNVDDIDDSSENNDKDKDIPIFQCKLEYDFEKKQVFLNVLLDKQRTVKISGSNYISNEVNHYIKSLDNNVPFDLTLNIDNKEFNYKLIKSGEFYLLISISPVNYNDYSTIVEYFGYNFTSYDNFEAYPPKDIYDDNGNYEVLIKSKNTQHVFLINITGIDYRRPSVDIGLLDDNTFHLEIEDDFGLDYLITFDGEYVPLNNNSSDTIEYNHKKEILYNGNYIFIAVDKKGNRTTKIAEIKSERRLTRPHAINLEVHDFKDTENLFKNIGLEFDNKKDNTQQFYNILPSYMNGKSPNTFNPDSPISRAEIITIFCRLNNLPYDTGARLKSKFTDIENHWARDYISMGSNKKYVSGYKDKTFKPDNNITRAEFCQMLTKISSYKSLLNAIPASTNIEYPDIYGHWAESEILKIAGRNLVQGNVNNFYPDKPITRGEVVHAINMLYGYNPTFSELQFIKSLYNEYYYFHDIQNHKFYNDIIISVVGMYREKID